MMEIIAFRELRVMPYQAMPLGYLVVFQTESLGNRLRNLMRHLRS